MSTLRYAHGGNGQAALMCSCQSRISVFHFKRFFHLKCESAKKQRESLSSLASLAFWRAEGALPCLGGRRVTLSLRRATGGRHEGGRRDSIFSPDLVNGAETGSFPPRRPTHALARSPDSQIDTRDREGGRGLGVNVRVEKEREREREMRGKNAIWMNSRRM